MIKLLLLSFLKITSAFTNGTLLPSYLCGLQNDGYPKSVGTLIPYLQLGKITTAYNQFPPGEGTIQILINNGDNAPTGNALAPNAQQIIGSFHNGQPQNGFITASKNPITIIPTDFTDLNTGIVNPNFIIQTGVTYKLSIVVAIPTFNDPNTALDGSFVYAMDTITGERIGQFIDPGPNMKNWYACTLNGKYPDNVGIVHTQLLSETAIYGPILWKAPTYIQGNIAFIGAGVTDAGFGPFSNTYNTINSFQITVADFFPFFIVYGALAILYGILHSNRSIFNSFKNLKLLGHKSIGILILISIHIIWWLVFYFYIFTLNDVNKILKMLGVWISIVVSFSLLGISKSNIILCNITYKEIIYFHKVNSIFLAVSLIIKVISVSVFVNNFAFLSNFSNIMGTVSTIIFPIIILSYYICNIENKKIIHFILILTLIITMSLHNLVFFIYILPSLFLNILDIILRRYYTLKCIHGHIIHIDNDRYNKSGIFIHITLFNKLVVKPGSYFYVKCEDIDRKEWQLLSVYSQDTDDSLLFFARNKLENTWKNKINNIEKLTKNIKIRGPYNILDTNFKNNLICIAVDSGIISILSLLNSKDIVDKLKNVFVIWIVSNDSLVKTFQKNMNTLKIQNNVDFEIKKIKDCEGEDNISKIIKDNFYENKLSSSETSCICVGSSEVCEESIITCSNLNIKITVQNFDEYF